MTHATYKAAEARSRFSELLSRAHQGEEIIITRGSLPIARLAPVRELASREAAPLAHLNWPEDLFDAPDVEQSAIDAGEYNDALGIWQGRPKKS